MCSASRSGLWQVRLQSKQKLLYVLPIREDEQWRLGILGEHKSGQDRVHWSWENLAKDSPSPTAPGPSGGLSA